MALNVGSTARKWLGSLLLRPHGRRDGEEQTMITQTVVWNIAECFGADGRIYFTFVNKHTKTYTEFEVDVTKADEFYTMLGKQIEEAKK